jgi:hypothetical protein
LKADLQEALADIKEELDEFKSLDKLERMHLQILLKVCDEEEKSILKEKKLAEGDTETLDYIQEDF